MRKEFEKWISAPPYEKSTRRFSDNSTTNVWSGQYWSYYVQIAWEAWQAGAKNVENNESAKD